MSGVVFINYRRSDASGWAGRLFDRLENALPKEKLFLDVDGIATGKDFVAVINKQIAACDVMLAIIGPNWIKEIDREEYESDQKTEDFVRIEIETALEQKKEIIPVLVGGAKMPLENDLPPTLRPFSRRQAARLSHNRFNEDTAALIVELKVKLAELEEKRKRAAITFDTTIDKFVTDYLGSPFGGRNSEIEMLNWWFGTPSIERRNAGPPADTDVRLCGDLSANNLLITAPAGRGKTALLVRWFQQLGNGYNIIFVPISIRYATNQAAIFYNALASQLAQLFDDEELIQPRTDPAIYYRNKTIDLLARVENEGVRCLIVIDGLDEARGWPVDTSVLPKQPSDGLRVVVSARELAGHTGPEQWRDAIGWSAIGAAAATYRVGPLLRAGVSDVLGQMGLPLSQLSTNVDVIDELYRLTEKGDPLLLTLYVRELLGKHSGESKLAPEDLRNLKPGFGAFFRDWINRQKEEWEEKKVDENFINVLFAVFACAYGPMQLSELEAVAGRLSPTVPFFSRNTLQPIERFVIGGGTGGYALGHPKLGDFLRDEHFQNTTIIDRAAEAFIAWMQAEVAGLNAGKTKPEKAAPYPLVYFTQHLGQLPPVEALEDYRSLLEDGWRRAWIANEGGTLGFTRDVELAAAAFREAHAEVPELRYQPEVGFAARVRCALCLSTLRSLGKGIPDELLAELLRSGGLTAEQALNFAIMKTDHDRSGAIIAIFALLPKELKRKAYAAVREIANPEWRGDVLVKIAKDLSEPPRQEALRDAVRQVARMEQGWRRDNLVEELRSWVESEPWIEEYLKVALAEAPVPKGKRVSQSAGPEAAMPRPEKKKRSAERIDWADLNRIKDEIANHQPSRKQLLELVRRVGKVVEVQAYLIIEIIARFLDESLRSALIDVIENFESGYFSNRSFESLGDYLVNDAELMRVVQISVGRSGNAKVLEKILPRLSKNDFEAVIRRVGEIDNDWNRGRVLVSLAVRLPFDKVLELLLADADRTPHGYYSAPSNLEEAARSVGADSVLELLSKHFKAERVVGARAAILGALVNSLPDGRLELAIPYLMKVEEASQLSSIIISLVPRLPPESLRKCLSLVRRMGNPSERGKALAVLIPRLKELGESVSARDAYAASFLIGDLRQRAIVRLALSNHAGAAAADSAAEIALQELESSATMVASGDERPLQIVATVLASGRADKTRRSALVEAASTIISNESDEQQQKSLSLMLALAFDDYERIERLETAATELVGFGEASERATFFAMVAALSPLDNYERALERAEHETLNIADGETRKVVTVSLRLIDRLLNGDFSELDAAFSEFGTDIFGSEHERLAWSNAITLALAPKLPLDEAVRLRRSVLEAIEALVSNEDYESRLLAAASVAPYLNDDDLLRSLEAWLDAAQQSSRDKTLLSLALMQGLLPLLVRHRPILAGNIFEGSPLASVGGAVAVDETLRAVNDVCSWWP